MFLFNLNLITSLNHVLSFPKKKIVILCIRLQILSFCLHFCTQYFYKTTYPLFLKLFSNYIDVTDLFRHSLTGRLAISAIYLLFGIDLNLPCGFAT